MQTYKFDAFISYRHVSPDMQIAAMLQELLEKYKAPHKAACRRTRKIKRIFRDKTELPISADLGKDIRDALDASEFLIAVCSPAFLKSVYCMREVEYFKKIHGGSTKNILVVLVDGTPKESIPEALHFDKKITVTEDGTVTEETVEVEPLAANVTDGHDLQAKKKLLKREFLRIAAPLLGCSFDGLYQRHKRRRLKRLLTWFAVLTLAIGYTGYREIQKNSIEQTMEFEQSVHHLDAAETLIEGGDKLLASLLISDTVSGTDRQDSFVRNRAEILLSRSTYLPAYEKYGILHTGNPVADIVFSVPASTLALANGNGVTFFGVQNGAELGHLVTEFAVSGLCACDDLLYAVGDKGQIAEIDVGNRTIKKEYTAQLPFADCYMVDADIYENKLVLFYGVTEKGEGRKCVSVYDLDTNETVLVTDRYWDKTLLYEGDTEILFYESDTVWIPEEEAVCLYKLKTGEKISLYTPEKPYVKCLPTKGKDGQNCVVTVFDDAVDVLHVADGKAQTLSYAEAFAGGNPAPVRISENGRFLAVARYKEGDAMVWDLWNEDAEPFHINNTYEYQFCMDLAFINEKDILIRSGAAGTILSVYRFQEEQGFSYLKRTESGAGEPACACFGEGTFAIADQNGKTMLYKTTDDDKEENTGYADYGTLYFDYSYFNISKDCGLMVEDETIYVKRLTDGEVLYTYTAEEEPMIYAVSADLTLVLVREKSGYKLIHLVQQSEEEKPLSDFDSYDAIAIVDAENFVVLEDGNLYTLHTKTGEKTLLATLSVDTSAALIWTIKVDMERDRAIVSHSFIGNPMDSIAYVIKLSDGAPMFSEKGYYLSAYTLNQSATDIGTVYYADNLFEKKFHISSSEEIYKKTETMLAGRKITAREKERLGIQ